MSEIEVTILGSGSSGGVPRIGGPGGAGDWGACDPNNPKNFRRRCSILVRQKSDAGVTAAVVDTAPEFREQMVMAKCGALDAVLITHNHADQTHGLDDIRAVAYEMRKRLPLYTDRRTLDGLFDRFGYIFETPKGSSYPPIATAHEITAFEPLAISGAGGPLPVLPFWQEHGTFGALGFRFGPVAYSSDVNALPEESFEALEGLDLWIVDALRYTPHPTHAHVALALEWIDRLKPKRAVLTNLHIDLDYETLKRELPPNVEPAYDGMVLRVS
jgi:phosphoribosyl 1,2-cyclic phosphate phosphodiesterase